MLPAICSVRLLDQTWAEAAQCVAARAQEVDHALTQSLTTVLQDPASATIGDWLSALIVALIFMVGLALVAIMAKALLARFLGRLSAPLPTRPPSEGR